MTRSMLIITPLFTLLAGSALAETPAPKAPPASQVWQGTGQLFSAEGKAAGAYRLELVRKRAEDGLLQTVRVFLPDGQIQTLQCEITEEGEAWSSVCGHGRGGGRCFGDGLCLDYLTDDKGRAFATTIVFDDDDSMRLLRTELLRGEAIRFYREKLERVAE